MASAFYATLETLSKISYVTYLVILLKPIDVQVQSKVEISLKFRFPSATFY